MGVGVSRLSEGSNIALILQVSYSVTDSGFVVIFTSNFSTIGWKIFGLE